MNFTNCIVTDRLILRPFAKGDEQDVLDIMSDHFTARCAGFKPFTKISEAERFIRSWRNGGYAITERSSDSVIGIIQLPVRYDWKTHTRKTFIGYWLAEEYRGKGYMTEAVEAMKEYVFDSTWSDEMELYVYCGNEASRNVALKCGFFPKWEAFKENVYSGYGRVESEEIFNLTRGDFEWQRNHDRYSTTA